MSRQLVPPVVTEGEALTELRLEVRDFLAEQVAAGRFAPHVDTWLTRWDRDFTRELGRRGWLGMVIPKEYGGQGRTYSSGSSSPRSCSSPGRRWRRTGSPSARSARPCSPTAPRSRSRPFLPAISRGELVFGIGMSEPDSGSDLASVRTRAERVDGGWRLTGTKVWTSGAHEADAFFALARTAPLDPAHRHDGLSQFIVDLRAPGVHIRPIVSMNGDHHFNEVHLDGVLVPDDRVLGGIGAGWTQVTSELGLRAQRARAGPVDLPAARRRRAGDGRRPAARSTRARPARRAGRRRCTRCPSPSRHALEAHEPADTAARRRQGARHDDRGRHRRLRRRCSPRPAGSRTRSSTRLLHGADPPAPGLHPARRHQRDPARRHRPRAGDALMTSDRTTAPRRAAAAPTRTSSRCSPSSSRLPQQARRRPPTRRPRPRPLGPARGARPHPAHRVAGARGQRGTWVDAAALLGIAPRQPRRRCRSPSTTCSPAGCSRRPGCPTTAGCAPYAVRTLPGSPSTSRGPGTRRIVVALWEDRDEWRVADVPSEHVGHHRRAQHRRASLATRASSTSTSSSPVWSSSHAVGEQFHLRGALARSAQVVGAMERVVELVLRARRRARAVRPADRRASRRCSTSSADIATETALGRAATDAAVARAVGDELERPRHALRRRRRQVVRRSRVVGRRAQRPPGARRDRHDPRARAAHPDQADPRPAQRVRLAPRVGRDPAEPRRLRPGATASGPSSDRPRQLTTECPNAPAARRTRRRDPRPRRRSPHDRGPYDVADGVATITLDAPERRNALSVEMSRELIDAARAAESDPSVGALVVTGGRALLRRRGPQRPRRHRTRPRRGRAPTATSRPSTAPSRRSARSACRPSPQCAEQPSARASTSPSPPTCASSRAPPGCCPASPRSASTRAAATSPCSTGSPGREAAAAHGPLR